MDFGGRRRLKERGQHVESEVVHGQRAGRHQYPWCLDAGVVDGVRCDWQARVAFAAIGRQLAQHSRALELLPRQRAPFDQELAIADLYLYGAGAFLELCRAAPRARTVSALAKPVLDQRC